MESALGSAFASASAVTDQRQKIEQYKLILASVLASNDVTQAKKFIDHVLSDEVPLVVSRQLLQTFAQELGRLEPEAQKEIGHYILNQIQPWDASFDEQTRHPTTLTVNHIGIDFMPDNKMIQEVVKAAGGEVSLKSLSRNKALSFNLAGSSKCESRL